jgi:hypothetical protein
VVEEVNRPLERCAKQYVLLAKKELGTDDLPDNLDRVIDALADHNQLMIEAIEAVSPDLNAVIDEFMRVDSAVWVPIVNRIFDIVKELIEGDDDR